MKKILFIIDYQFYLLFLEKTINLLLEERRYEIVFFSGKPEVLEKIVSHFQKCQRIDNKSYLETFLPDVVVCLDELWHYNVFKLYRSKNIPVIHYDHGSYYCRAYYLLEKDEDRGFYRSNVSMCSHVACWGEHGRDNWLSFGVPKEKFYVTGGMQFDYLYQRDFESCSERKSVYDQLGISSEKKILLFFSSLRYPNIKPKPKQRILQILKQLERVSKKFPEYQLVIKPHPLDLISPLPFPYPKEAIIIANIHEEAGQTKAVRIDMNKVVANAYAVVSIYSSVIIGPLILNIPIIYAHDDSMPSKDLLNFGKDAFVYLKKGQSISSVLKNLDKIYESKKKRESQRLAALMNFNNDGKATIRFNDLLKKVLEEKEEGKQFYIPEEDEFLGANIQFPDLPYSYRNLFEYHFRVGNWNKAEYWMGKYIENFKHPEPLTRQFMNYCLRPDLDKKESFRLLEKYQKYLGLDGIFRLAIYYRENNKSHKALNILAKIKTNGINQEARRNIIYETALNNLVLKNYDEGIRLLKMVLRGTEEQSSLKYRIYFRLGETYYICKKYGNARIHLKSCLRLQTNHGKAAELLEKIPER